MEKCWELTVHGDTALSRDKRPIKSVTYDDAEGSCWIVGSGGCTKIVPYDECGAMAPFPMLAVFVGDEIKARVPAEKVTVIY
jgi:hypothetical protein